MWDFIAQRSVGFYRRAWAPHYRDKSRQGGPGKTTAPCFRKSPIKTKNLPSRKGGVEVEKAVIEGYGPPDLVDRMKNATWTACIPSGQNFDGIVLGDCVLTDAPDEFFSIKFRVTLETVPNGDKFTVEGYNSRLFLDSIHKESGPNTFAGCCLTNHPSDETKAYRVTVETT